MKYLKDLPIGSKVRETKSNTLFLVADHDHTGWKGTTLVADKTCLISCLDAAEPMNPNAAAAQNGNNIYALSNIHMWLNSADENWYVPSHEYDMPPREEAIYSRCDVFESRYFDQGGMFAPPYAYDDLPGYLSRFDKSFVDLIEESIIYAAGPTDPNIVNYGPPLAQKVRCRVFLPSCTEMGLENEIRQEGSLIRLFIDPRMRMCAPENGAIHRDEDFVYKQSAVATWLRSPDGDDTGLCKIYQVEHKLGDIVGATAVPRPVNYAAGIRPVMNLCDDAPVSERLKDGTYNICKEK